MIVCMILTADTCEAQYIYYVMYNVAIVVPVFIFILELVYIRVHLIARTRSVLLE